MTWRFHKTRVCSGGVCAAMSLRHASARHSGEGYGPAPGRSAPLRSASSAAAPPLPDLTEVARRLAASHFVCVAACHVMKPPPDDGHAHAGVDVRVLAVGYAAGQASLPELLKISSTPAFSVLRSWKTCGAARGLGWRATRADSPFLKRCAPIAGLWPARRLRSAAPGRCA